MKLGNQGFGLKEMIIYTCLLLLLLIFVTIEINSFYKSLPTQNSNNNQSVVETPTIENNTNTNNSNSNFTTPDTYIDYNYYHGLENRLKLATQNYLEENPYSLGNEILTLETTALINLGYLTTLYAQDNESTCSGYSNIYQQEDGSYIINPFITCYNYQTPNS